MEGLTSPPRRTRFSSLKHIYIKIYVSVFSGSFQPRRQNRPSGLGVHELWLLFLTLVLYFLLLSLAPAMPVILCWPLWYQLPTGAFLKYIKKFLFFGCAGSLLLHVVLLQWWMGATLHCSMLASPCSGLPHCRAWTLGTRTVVVAALVLSSYGAWA